MTKQNDNVIPPTISVAEAARVFDVTPATMYRWTDDGDIPKLTLGGRIRIPTAKLAELLGLEPADLARAMRAIPAPHSHRIP